MVEEPNHRPVWKLLLLAAGIYVAPYIFAWFTLRDGYSTTWRVVSFTYAILLLASVVALVVFNPHRPRGEIIHGNSVSRSEKDIRQTQVLRFIV
jgi:FtsH-binding integral membrane protein